MLLKSHRAAQRRRVLTMLRSDDQGAALAAVIGLMAALLMLSVVLVTSVYQTTAFTSYSRAGVQSQASAEAGISAARAWLISGQCTPSSTDPSKTTITNATFGVDTIFSVTIQVKEGGSWVTKCPASLSVPVRIESTGTASAKGAGAMSGADTTTLEAILSSQAGEGNWEGTGAAVFAYRSDGFTAGGKMFSVDGTDPDILVKTGDLNCTGNAQGVKHLVVEGGDLAIGNSCNVDGNVWASGDVTVSGNIRVGLATCPSGQACGNVVAGEDFNMSGGAIAYGNVWAHGRANFTSGSNGRVYGQLKARSLYWGGSHLYSSTATSYIYGPAEFRAGNPTLNKDIVVQQVTYPAGGHGSINPVGIRNKTIVQNPIVSPSFTSDLPASPIVPDWFDYAFDPADWEGFVTIAITPNSSAVGYQAPTWYNFENGWCKAPEINAAVAAAGGSKLVIDARGCANGVKFTGTETATINADIAIIANKFQLGNSGKILSGSGTPHRIWLVTPDTNTALVDGKPAPHCAANQGFTMDGSFTFGTTGATANRVMIYTPCRVNMTSGNSMWGQVFSGEAAINGNFSLYYDPIGFPGWDLDTGLPVGGGGSEADRVVESIRNVG